MPIFHFNVHDGVSRPDRDGRELADLEAAKRAAVDHAGHLIQRFAPDFWKGEEWRMDVTDGAGLVLFTLTFFGSLAASTRHTGARRVPV